MNRKYRASKTKERKSMEKFEHFLTPPSKIMELQIKIIKEKEIELFINNNSLIVLLLSSL